MMSRRGLPFRDVPIVSEKGTFIPFVSSCFAMITDIYVLTLMSRAAMYGATFVRSPIRGLIRHAAVDCLDLMLRVEVRNCQRRVVEPRISSLESASPPARPPLDSAQKIPNLRHDGRAFKARSPAWHLLGLRASGARQDRALARRRREPAHAGRPVQLGQGCNCPARDVARLRSPESGDPGGSGAGGAVGECRRR